MNNSKAFIDWKRVTPENTPVSGKTYMVAEIHDVNGKYAKPRFATWYNAGDTVQMECKKPSDFNNMSAENRLLIVLFGLYESVTIERSGFYIKTSDYGVDNENHLYEMVPLSEDIYFAESPLMPEGYLSEEQHDIEYEAKMKRKAEEHDENHLAKLTDDMNGYEPYALAYKELIDKTDKPLSYNITHDIEVKLGKVTLKTARIIEYMISQKDVAACIAAIYTAFGGRDNLVNAIVAGAVDNNIHDIVFKILEDNKVPKYKHRMIAHLLEHLVNDRAYNFYRDKALKNEEYDEKTLPRMLVRTYAYHKYATQILRMAYLMHLQAPTIILGNELVIVMRSFLLMKHHDSMEIDAQAFSELFGMNMDGTCYEGMCYSGNLENCYDDREMTEYKDEYCIVASPNYLCLDGLYALYNFASNTYYRENDKILLYNDIRKADEKCDMLNK